MKNNVIVFDLDGTLLDSNNQMIGGAKTLACLNTLQQTKCTLAICTGRLDHDIVKICQEYGLDMKHRISQNGAVLYQDNQLKATLLDKQEALDIYHELKTKDIRIELNTISNRYWTSERDPLFPKEFYDSHIIKEDFEDILLYQPAVLFLIVAQEQQLKQIEETINQNYQFTKAIRTSQTSLEIVHSSVSKGEALKILYPDCQIYAIGDSPSDFEMFPFSKIGYLVSNQECHYPCQRKETILEALQDIISHIK